MFVPIAQAVAATELPAFRKFFVILYLHALRPSRATSVPAEEIA